MSKMIARSDAPGTGPGASGYAVLTAIRYLALVVRPVAVYVDSTLVTPEQVSAKGFETSKDTLTTTWRVADTSTISLVTKSKTLPMNGLVISVVFVSVVGAERAGRPVSATIAIAKRITGTKLPRFMVVSSPGTPS